MTAHGEAPVALAQLRHAYKHAIDGTIGDQSSYGRYLLGPAIERVEAMQAQLLAAEQAREELQRECDDRKAQQQLLVHKVITCGVAATHPNSNLTREKKCYAETWNSPQAEAVRKLRARAEQAEAALAAERGRREAVVVKLRASAEYLRPAIETGDIAEMPFSIAGHVLELLDAALAAQDAEGNA